MQNDFSLYRPRQPSYFLDLFSGIGGFHLGAQWAGLRFDGYYYSEVDPYAIKVYAKRFHDSIGLGDIAKIDGRALPQGDWIIAGGFPCQDISVAGKGAGLAGSRSGLWYEYARLIGEIRPRIAIMENVGALTFRGLDAVLGSLAEIGYDAEWQDIRASDVGAPHRRERIWIMAYPAISERATGAEKPGKLREVFENWREHDNADGSGTDVPNSDEIMRNRSRGTWNGRVESTDSRETMADSDSYRPYRTQGDATKQGSDGENDGLSFRGSSWWAAEPDVGRVAHGVPSRVDRLKCLGNSIVPQIAQMIFQQPAFDEWRNNAE